MLGKQSNSHCGDPTPLSIIWVTGWLSWTHLPAAHVKRNRHMNQVTRFKERSITRLSRHGLPDRSLESLCAFHPICHWYTETFVLARNLRAPFKANEHHGAKHQSLMRIPVHSISVIACSALGVILAPIQAKAWLAIVGRIRHFGRCQCWALLSLLSSGLSLVRHKLTTIAICLDRHAQHNADLCNFISSMGIWENQHASNSPLAGGPPRRSAVFFYCRGGYYQKPDIAGGVNLAARRYVRRRHLQHTVVLPFLIVAFYWVRLFARKAQLVGAGDDIAAD